MTDLKPQIITGLPAGTKEAGRRVDFRPDNFDLSITTKGYRCWWSRAAPCPCVNNVQTRQPDPSCVLCDGYGEMLFLPDPAAAWSSEDQHGNPIEVSDDRLSVGIQVLMTGISRNKEIFERFGSWTMGQAMCTTQAGNELGFRDRLVLRDATIHWSELVDADGAQVIKVGRRLQRIRYRAVSVTLLRSQATVYEQPRDFSINSDGQVVWSSAATPAEGTTLAIHYKAHPVYRIIDWPHTIRDTLVAAKSKALSKAEQHRRLPTQCTAKLDFLIEDEG